MISDYFNHCIRYTRMPYNVYMKTIYIGDTILHCEWGQSKIDRSIFEEEKPRFFKQ